MSTKIANEASIYGAYRLTLRSLRGGRAGSRKQRAREIVADRYKTPISEVKAIVSKFEESEGISHEAPAVNERERVAIARVEYLNSINDGSCHMPNHDSSTPVGGKENEVKVRIMSEWGTPYADSKFLLSCFNCYLENATIFRSNQ